MSQQNESVNKHLEEYLYRYCRLTVAPKFAVLVKGQWGWGKTWFIKQFIKQYREDYHSYKIDIWKTRVDIKMLAKIWHSVILVPNKICHKLLRKEQISSKKFLYISLYGLETLSAIDEAIFQELHPLWSSHQIKVAGNIFKAFLQGSLKIDLNSSGKDMASWNIKIPDIPSNLKDANNKEVNKRILVFDDLERCSINITNLLGYINQFIEHQNLKIIILADETKLFENKDYLSFKEKLIGKTFEVFPDFKNALKDFVKDTSIESFLLENSDFIEDIYRKYNSTNKTDKYKNIRDLKRIVLDFQWIFDGQSEKVQNNPEALKDILQFLMLFSIEISRAKIKSSDITKLVHEYKSRSAKQSLKAILGDFKDSAESTKNDKDTNAEEFQNRVKENYGLYFEFSLDKIFPSEIWWENFFDKGLIDSVELNRSILSKYFPEDENIPNWRRLYYFKKLSDQNFETLLKKVESECSEKKFVDIGEVKHVFGVLLTLSHEGLYDKTKEDIFLSAKAYIDDLNSNGKIPPQLHSIGYDKFNIRFNDNFDNLIFAGFDLSEFQKIIAYVDNIQESVRIKNLPHDAKKLLGIMENNPREFYKMVCLNNEVESEYCTVPIFKYVDVNSFINILLSINYDSQELIFIALKKRYKIINDDNKELIDEIEWLKKLQELIKKEFESKKDKPTRYRLAKLNEDYLDKTIKDLELNQNNYI